MASRYISKKIASSTYIRSFITTIPNYFNCFFKEGMPKILRRISWYLPCTAACQAMRDIMAKGWDISNSSIPIGIGASISWICIFVFASWIAMKIKSR